MLMNSVIRYIEVTIYCENFILSNKNNVKML
jgi:hypothetical protein